MTKISIDLPRLMILKFHSDNGQLTLHVSAGELTEINEYRRTMGMGTHATNEALTEMIAEKKKEAKP